MTTDWIDLGTFTSLPISTIYSFYYFPFVEKAYSLFRIDIHGTSILFLLWVATRSSWLEIYELRLLSCNIPSPTSIVFSPNEIIAQTFVDYVFIAPMYGGYGECKVDPALPSGLTLNSATCKITGILEESVNANYTVYCSVPKNMKGIIHIQSSSCEGVILMVSRQYQMEPYFETYSISKSDSHTIVLYEEANSNQIANGETFKRVCVSEGDYYLIMGHETQILWECDSTITLSLLTPDGNIQMTLLKSRYDTTIGQTMRIDFSTKLLISSQVEWEVSFSFPSEPDWFSSTSVLWERQKVSELSPSVTGQEFYRRFFFLNETRAHTLILNIRFLCGCVIYVNGRELHRRFVDDLIITNTTVATDCYDSLKYHTLSFPLDVMVNSTYVENLVHLGTNIVSIVLISPPNSEPTFDVVLRYSIQSQRSILNNYSITYSGSDNPKELFSYCSSKYYHYRGTHDNFFTISFDDDKREWVSGLEIISSTIASQMEPTTLIVEARNPEDSEWTLLLQSQNWIWWEGSFRKIIYLYAQKAFNEYRFSHIIRSNNTNNSTEWILQMINPFQALMNSSQVSLNYPQSITFFTNSVQQVISPLSCLFTNYIAFNSLPSGLWLDPATGTIGGVVKTSQTVTVSIQAVFARREYFLTKVNIQVNTCSSNCSIILIQTILPRFFGTIHMVLFNTTPLYPLWEIRDVHYMDTRMLFQFCLPHGIYTVAAESTDKQGWAFAAGYSVLLRSLSNLIEISHVDGSTIYSRESYHSFSSYDPFPLHQPFTYLITESPPSLWTSPSFNDLDWDKLVDSEVISPWFYTLYSRRVISIPDITKYHVLTVSVTTSACFIAYFNGRLIARFDLSSNATSVSTCLSTSPVLTTRTFHILLVETGGNTDTNCLAIEFHKHPNVDQSFYHSIEGHFGVDKNTPLFGTIKEATNVDSNQNGFQNLFRAFDCDISTFTATNLLLSDTVDMTFENLEGQRFNSFTFYSSIDVEMVQTQVFGELIAERQHHLDYNDDLEEIGSTLSISFRDRQPSRRPVLNGMAQLRRVRLYMISFASSPWTVRISEIVPSYTFFEGTRICPALGSFPAVKEGTWSPGPCPTDYTGIARRYCIEGQLGSVDLTQCVLIPPNKLHYSSATYSFYKRLYNSTSIPSYEYTIDRFDIVNGSLPEGLIVNTVTGEIAGIPQVTAKAFPVTIRGSNTQGYDDVTIIIEVKESICMGEKGNEPSEVFTQIWYSCASFSKGVGFLRRRCVFKDDFLWTTDADWCIRNISTFFVSLCLILAFMLIFVMLLQHCMVLQRRRRILQMSNTLMKRTYRSKMKEME